MDNQYLFGRPSLMFMVHIPLFSILKIALDIIGLG